HRGTSIAGSIRTRHPQFQEMRDHTRSGLTVSRGSPRASVPLRMLRRRRRLLAANIAGDTQPLTIALGSLGLTDMASSPRVLITRLSVLRRRRMDPATRTVGNAETQISPIIRSRERT